MTTINAQLSQILPTIRNHGQYYASGTSDIGVPTLAVDGVGRIALPLLPVQARQLIDVAVRSPFGRGEETLIDIDVRRTWQIGPANVQLGGRNWPKTLGDIVARAATGLGVSGTVSAELYKLLIYDVGSFFVEHRDTEKEPGMFATLVIVLPSDAEGGELVVRHRGQEVSLDLNCPDPADVAFAAFYADCVHEVRPVTSGARLTLIYNLVHKAKKPPTLPTYENERAQLSACLQKWVEQKSAENDDSPDKLIYPLEHAYTPAELGFDTLKSVDAAAATVLVAAADDAACDIYLGLVTIKESGSAESHYYSRPLRGRRHYHDEEDDDGGEDADFEIIEICDSDQRVSHWCHPDGSRPKLNALPFEESELCPPNAFEEMKPSTQSFHEATGNEGASFERSYQRAALVLWPRRYRLAVFNHAGLAVTLPYLGELAARWIDSGRSLSTPDWSDAHTLSGYMLRGWRGVTYRVSADQANNVAMMFTCLEKLTDIERIDSFLAALPALGLYTESINTALLGAACLLDAEIAASHITEIVGTNAYAEAAACAQLLRMAAGLKPFSAQPALLIPPATALVETLLGLRVQPTPASPWRQPQPPTPALLDDLLSALTALNLDAMGEQIASYVLANPAHFPIDGVVIPATLMLRAHQTSQSSDAALRLTHASVAHLRTRIALPLSPPVDFARASGLACKCKDCTELSQFLADKARGRWVFRAAALRRTHVESSIRQAVSDVDCVTINRGNPHELHCTKNQASFARRSRQREDDLSLLRQLEAAH